MSVGVVLTETDIVELSEGVDKEIPEVVSQRHTGIDTYTDAAIEGLTSLR